MGRVKEMSNVFEENYHGLLSHDGSLKVAKTEIKQKILHISKRTVQVMGRKNSYHAEIHKDMYTFMDFVEAGDYAYIKFRRGKAWFVGFQKQKAYKNEEENCSFQTVLDGVDI